MLAAGAEVLLVLGGFLGMWVRVNIRLTALETRLEAAEGILRRIEDAIWTQAGIAILKPQERPQRR